MELTTAELNAIKPKTLNEDGSLLTISQWAEKERVVNVGPRQGHWSNDPTPYLVEPMDALTEPGVNEVILCFAPQTGKTQVGFNFLGYVVDQEPDPILYVLPDEKTCRRMAKRRILPMLRTCPATARQLPESGQDENIFNVSFRNGMDLFLAWASSASELASESIRYVIFDETDKYPAFSGREADPISLGKARTITYGDDAKVLYLSTPTTETGVITRALDTVADEVRRYNAVCPECGTAQLMDTGQIRWPESVRDPRVILRKRLAYYVCAHCGATWNDLQRDQAVRHGFWQADDPVDQPRAVGFHLPSFYSPFVSLSQVAADFLKAEAVRDTDKAEYLSRRMVFVTQHEARAWKEKQRTADLEEMRSYISAEIPGGTAPAGTVALTMGVDMQRDYFLYSVRACGRFDPETEAWSTATIDYGRIETWDDLQQMITDSAWPLADSEQRMALFRVALDTGGGESESGLTRTEQAYLFLQRFSPSHVVGIKGASGKKARSISVSRVDALPQSQKKMRPVMLYLLDTESFKDLLWERIRDGSHVFSADTGDDFLRQLLAEEKVLERGRYRWKQRGGRANHYLDIEMMHEAMNSSLWKPVLQALRKPVGMVQENEVKPKLPKSTPQQKKAREDPRPRPSWFYNR
jgi:phage terminase large subunit GpA-like protein